MNLKLLFILSFSTIFFSAEASFAEFNPNFWTGHQVHVAPGFIVTKAEKTLPDRPSPIKLIGLPTLFYGYEYGYQFSKHWFVGGGLEWTISYHRNFVDVNKSLDKERARKMKLVSWLQPLTHIRMGYVFNNHILLSLGLTYLWALDLDAKLPMNDHFFVRINYIQWLDTLLSLQKASPSLLAGFDLADFSIGVGYKF